MATVTLQLFDNLGLVLGQDPGEHLLDAEVLGHAVGHGAIVTGHHRHSHSEPPQLGNRLL